MKQTLARKLSGAPGAPGAASGALCGRSETTVAVQQPSELLPNEHDGKLSGERADLLEELDEGSVRRRGHKVSLRRSRASGCAAARLDAYSRPDYWRMPWVTSSTPSSTMSRSVTETFSVGLGQ
jgi:hypothetical protein